MTTATEIVTEPATQGVAPLAAGTDEGPPPDLFETEMIIPVDSPFFQGHFDGDPVLPAAAQLDSFILPEVERAWPKMGSLAAVRRVKFKRVLRPGNKAIVRLERRGNDVLFEMWSDGPVSSGVLSFAR